MGTAGPLVSLNPGDLIADNGPGGNNPFGSAAPAVTVVRPPAPCAVRLPVRWWRACWCTRRFRPIRRLPLPRVTQGTVVLQATIARDGSIEEPARSQRSAHAATGGARCGEHLRYRPYMLNGQPIEVETTVNVVFKLE